MDVEIQTHVERKTSTHCVSYKQVHCYDELKLPTFAVFIFPISFPENVPTTYKTHINGPLTDILFTAYSISNESLHTIRYLAFLQHHRREQL